MLKEPIVDFFILLSSLKNVPFGQILLHEREGSRSEWSHDGLGTGSISRVESSHVTCLSKHVVPRDLVHHGLLFGHDFEHDGHDPHQADARASPEHLECESLDDGEDVIEAIDHSQEHATRIILEEFVFVRDGSCDLLLLSSDFHTIGRLRLVLVVMI